MSLPTVVEWQGIIRCVWVWLKEGMEWWNGKPDRFLFRYFQIMKCQKLVFSHTLSNVAMSGHI